MGNFFELYDSNFFLDENIILIELILLLILFLHNNQKNVNDKLFEPYTYKKTIESILCDNFILIALYKTYFDLNEKEKNKIIQYLIDNISIIFSSLYQTLILGYLNHLQNLGNNYDENEMNIICKYAQRLCEEFGIKKEEYKNYIENEKLLIDVIEKSISKNKKNKNI